MTYDIELAKQITGIENETLLEFYINAIIDKINNILGYNILEHDKTEYITGVDKNYVYVNDRPLNSISKIEKDGIDITSQCFVMSDRKIFTPYEICSQHSIKATYNAGYSELPPSIQLFIFSQVKSSVVGVENSGLKSYSIESISYTFNDKQSENNRFINDVKNLFGGL